jgi:hypothetical protein
MGYSVGVMRDRNLKLEDLKVNLTLGGVGEGDTYGESGTRREDKSISIEMFMVDVFVKINPTDPLRFAKQATTTEVIINTT